MNKESTNDAPAPAPSGSGVREAFDIASGLLRDGCTYADRKAAADYIRALASPRGEAKFKIGDRVTKTKGSSWTGRVVGTYSTALTPEGYAVESETETGSVQIYPAAALAPATNKE